MSLPPLPEKADRLVDAGSTSGSEASSASLSTSISVALDMARRVRSCPSPAVPGKACHCDARVIQKARVHLRSVCVLRSGEGFLDSGHFFRRDAGIALAGFASQRRGIEVTAERVGDHSVGNAVFCVALLHEGIHEELTIAFGEELVDLRRAGCVFRRGLVIGYWASIGLSQGWRGRCAWRDRLKRCR